MFLSTCFASVFHLIREDHMRFFLQRLLPNPSNGKIIALSMMVIVCLFALCLTNVRAQESVPPIVSDTMWTFTRFNPNEGPALGGPFLALAEKADILFYTPNNYFLIVFDATTGFRIDSIDLRPIVGKPNLRPQRIYSSSDGSRLCVMWLSSGSLHISVISYPENKLIKELPFEIPNPWEQYVCSISPNGRFVVAPRLIENSTRFALYDLERDTMFALPLVNTDSYSNSMYDFDDASAQLVYTSSSVAGSQLTIMELTSGEYRRSYIPGRFTSPTFSGDGKFIITSADITTNLGLSWYPRVHVYDVATGEKRWGLSGKLETGDERRYDMHSYALSTDGQTAFVFRNDTSMAEELRTGMFYRLTDTIPFARCETKTFTNHDDFTGFSLFSSDLTRGYMSADILLSSTSRYKCDILAGRFNLALSSISDGQDVKQFPLLYPNPASGTVNARWVGENAKVRWSIVSIGGQELAVGPAEAIEHLVTIELPTNLPRGSHLLRIASTVSAQSLSYTLVIQ